LTRYLIVVERRACWRNCWTLRRLPPVSGYSWIAADGRKWAVRQTAPLYIFLKTDREPVPAGRAWRNDRAPPWAEIEEQLVRSAGPTRDARGSAYVRMNRMNSTTPVCLCWSMRPGGLQIHSTTTRVWQVAGPSSASMSVSPSTSAHLELFPSAERSTAHRSASRAAPACDSGGSPPGTQLVYRATFDQWRGDPIYAHFPGWPANL
jgi:hypothetical protein